MNRRAFSQMSMSGSVWETKPSPVSRPIASSVSSVVTRAPYRRSSLVPSSKNSMVDQRPVVSSKCRQSTSSKALSNSSR